MRVCERKREAQLRYGGGTAGSEREIVQSELARASTRCQSFVVNEQGVRRRDACSVGWWLE